MIFVTLHALACIALVAASIYWKIQAPESHSIYRNMLPFIVSAGFFGIVILYRYVMELFVVWYSGAIYEVQGLTRTQLAWITISALLMLLPLIGLIPQIGKRGLILIVIGLSAATPSIFSLISAPNNKEQQAEQVGDGDAEEAV